MNPLRLPRRTPEPGQSCPGPERRSPSPSQSRSTRPLSHSAVQLSESDASISGSRAQGPVECQRAHGMGSVQCARAEGCLSTAREAFRGESRGPLDVGAVQQMLDELGARRIADEVTRIARIEGPNAEAAGHRSSDLAQRVAE